MKVVNRQLFTMWVGLAIVFCHIAITFYFLFLFKAPGEVVVQEINLPLTVAYVSSIVMWFFAGGGLVKSDEVIGLPLVILVVMIVASLLGALFMIPIVFQLNHAITVDEINTSYLYVETAFGGIFGIVMSELFGFKRN